MSPKERRAFASGYRFALREARRELNEMARRLDDEICRVDGEMRAAREQVAQRVDGEIAGLVGEMKGMRDEFRQYQAIEEAIGIERDVDTWLN
jgi:hypothetical protein